MTRDEQARFGIDKPAAAAAEPARPNFPPRLALPDDARVCRVDLDVPASYRGTWGPFLPMPWAERRRS